VAYALILTIWEAEIRMITVLGKPGKKFARPYFNGKKIAMVISACFPKDSGKYK
jgi:hypothetical protein